MSATSKQFKPSSVLALRCTVCLRPSWGRLSPRAFLPHPSCPNNSSKVTTQARTMFSQLLSQLAHLCQPSHQIQDYFNSQFAACHLAQITQIRGLWLPVFGTTQMVEDPASSKMSCKTSNKKQRKTKICRQVFDVTYIHSVLMWTDSQVWTLVQFAISFKI